MRPAPRWSLGAVAGTGSLLVAEVARGRCGRRLAPERDPGCPPIHRRGGSEALRSGAGASGASTVRIVGPLLARPAVVEEGAGEARCLGQPLQALAVRRHRHPQRLELASRPAGAQSGVDAGATVDDGEIRERGARVAVGGPGRRSRRGLPSPRRVECEATVVSTVRQSAAIRAAGSLCGGPGRKR